MLVVGTTPPGGGAFASALAARAVERRESGDEVVILSPDAGSAAHRTGRLDGFFLAARLAWLARRFDAVELRIEDGMPCRSTSNRLARGAYLLALGAALGRYGEVTVRPDTPIPIPGGLGGRATRRMWAKASRIVVWNDADEEMMLRTPGVTTGAVEIADRQPLAPERERSWPTATATDLRSEAMAVVRERAARDRRAIAGRARIGAPPTDPERTTPRTLELAHMALRTAAHRGARLVRRSLS